MKYFNIFIFLAYFHGISQVTEVQYNSYTNFGLPVTTQWTLVFDKNESYFLKEPKNNNGEKNNMFNVKKTASKHKLNVINYKVDFINFYRHDFVKDSLYSQVGILDQPYYVHEKIPELKWEIQEDVKTINNYQCQKAVTTFRGRTYYVWFTTAISTTAGPWKITGLPGLILRLENSSSTIVIQAKKIKNLPDENLSELVSFLKLKGENISIKEFVQLKDNEGDEMAKKMLAKMDIRNSSVSVSKPDERQGFEKIYEWEEEK